MNDNAHTSPPTTPQLDALEKLWSRISKIHTCEPGRATWTIHTVGFGEHGAAGLARNCCATCAPMFAEAVIKTCGAARWKSIEVGR